MLMTLSTTHKYLRSLFAKPNLHQSDHLNYLRTRQEYLTFMNFSILIILIKTFLFLFFPVVSSPMYISTLTFFTFNLHCLYKKRLLWLKTLYFCLCAFGPLLGFFLHSKETAVMMSPLLTTFMTVWCLITTKSLLATSACFTVNFSTTAYITKPYLLQIMTTGDFMLKQSLVENFITTGLNCNLCVCVISAILYFGNQGLLRKLTRKSDDLHKVNEELKESIKSKTNFLLSVSHELKNPLNGALGYIDLALSELKSDEQVKTYLKYSKVCGETLLYLINNLLDSGKMEKNDLEISTIPTDFHDFVEKMWITTSSLIKKMGLQGKLLVSKAVPRKISIDSHRLMQIIFNLVSNATKFTQKGAIQVKLSWVNRDVLDPEMFKPTEQSVPSNYSNSTGNYSNYSHKGNVDSNNSNNCNSSNYSNYSHKGNSSNYSPSNGNFSSYLKDDSGHADGFMLQGRNSRSSVKIVSESEIPYDQHAENSDVFEKIISHSRVNTQTEIPDFHHDYHILKLDQYKVPVHQVIPLSLLYLDRHENPHSSEKCVAGFLKIEVIDTGCGMSEDALNRIFEKFNQTGTASTKRLGAGLGLWITQHLCQKMGGNIKVYSKENHGSTFVAVIKSEIVIEPKSTNSVPHSRRTSISHEQKKILKAMIVDDSKMNRDILKGFLEKCGVFVTDVACNGLEALQRFQARGKNFFDFVFMDLEMPVMDGKEATRKIRECEVSTGANGVKVIVVSGNSNHEQLAGLLDKRGETRVDHVFSKPFTLGMCKNFMEKYNVGPASAPVSPTLKFRPGSLWSRDKPI